MSPIRHVQKRDGQLVDFEQNKITEAIWKSAQSVGGTDRALAEKISSQVTAVLEVFFKVEGPAPTVEQIQDLVEKILIEDGHAKTAKAYILYREEHKKLRKKREEILGLERLKLSSVDGENRQLGDFIILDIDDDLEAIFEGMKETVVIHQNGEKACVNFSSIRPAGDPVKNNQKASGPISFITLYDTAINTIKQEGQQTNHVMLLNVCHPNIQEFLNYEQTYGKLKNFTMMVEVNEKFMLAVESGHDLELMNPVNQKVTATISSKAIFDQLTKNSQENNGPKPIMIEYPENHERKHSSIQVNLPFDEDVSYGQEKPKHLAQEIQLPPIQTLS